MVLLVDTLLKIYEINNIIQFLDYTNYNNHSFDFNEIYKVLRNICPPPQNEP